MVPHVFTFLPLSDTLSLVYQAPLADTLSLTLPAANRLQPATHNGTLCQTFTAGCI